MSDDFGVEDVTAMREQGDLHAFMRSRIRRPGRQPAPQQPPRPPGHRPGAWPDGTGPPAPVNDAIPLAAWADALDAYRAWLLAGSPPTPITPCCCPACQRNPEEPR